MADTLSVTVRRRGMRFWVGRDALTVYALVAVVVVASITVPYFAGTATVNFLLIDAIPVLAIAMPMALIVITGEIDLSVASIAGLGAASTGVLFADARLPLPLIVLLVLLIGLACGAVNGFFVTVVGLPSLAVTIGTLALFRGLALVIIGDRAVADFPVEVTGFVTSTIGGTGIPTMMIAAAVVIALFGVLLHFTPFGRGLYAVGASVEAARFVGIRAGRSRFWLYLASGAVSAVVGVFWVLRYSSAQSDSVQGLELTVVAAVLLGGVSIFGGSGGIVGVVAGVLLIRTVNYSLQLAGLSDTVLTIVTGTLLVLSVVAPSAAGRVRATRDLRRARAELALLEPSAPEPGDSTRAGHPTHS